MTFKEMKMETNNAKEEFANSCKLLYELQNAEFFSNLTN